MSNYINAEFALDPFPRTGGTMNPILDSRRCASSADRVEFRIRNRGRREADEVDILFPASANIDK